MMATEYFGSGAVVGQALIVHCQRAYRINPNMKAKALMEKIICSSMHGPEAIQEDRLVCWNSRLVSWYSRRDERADHCTLVDVERVTDTLWCPYSLRGRSELRSVTRGSSN